jgi:branched-chain amino acid transport system substrate-binding protein
MKRKGSWITFLALAMVLGMSFGASAEEGVTDTTINIGQWGPQTGPAAAWGNRGKGHGGLLQDDQ